MVPPMAMLFRKRTERSRPPVCRGDRKRKQLLRHMDRDSWRLLNLNSVEGVLIGAMPNWAGHESIRRVWVVCVKRRPQWRGGQGARRDARSSLFVVARSHGPPTSSPGRCAGPPEPALVLGNPRTACRTMLVVSCGGKVTLVWEGQHSAMALLPVAEDEGCNQWKRARNTHTGGGGGLLDTTEDTETLSKRQHSRLCHVKNKLSSAHLPQNHASPLLFSFFFFFLFLSPVRQRILKERMGWHSFC
jgi:hypothetical protein